MGGRWRAMPVRSRYMMDAFDMTYMVMVQQPGKVILVQMDICSFPE